MTAHETGSGANDKLVVKKSCSTTPGESSSNTGAKSIWTSSAFSLASYAGERR